MQNEFTGSVDPKVYDLDADMLKMEPVYKEEFGILSTFKFKNDPNEVVWFIGNQVATILGYKKPRNAINMHVWPEDIKYAIIKSKTRGNGSKSIIINEYGVNALIRSSKLKHARKFQRWLDKDVIPSIRRYGRYVDNGSYRWLSARLFGKQTRKSMTENFIPFAVNQIDFALMTNTVYLAIFNHTASELKTMIGYNAENIPQQLLRDRLSTPALLFLDRVEREVDFLLIQGRMSEENFNSLLKDLRRKSVFWLNPEAPAYIIPFKVDEYLPRFPSTLEYFGVDLGERINPLDLFHHQMQVMDAARFRLAASIHY